MVAFCCFEAESGHDQKKQALYVFNTMQQHSLNCTRHMNCVPASTQHCKLPAVRAQHSLRLSVPPSAAAAEAGSQQQQQQAIVNPPQPLSCLKEWAVTIAALQTGQQTILLRKGGIREPTFTPQATRFMMFPTSFHSQEQLLKPGIAEQYQQEMQLEPKQLPELPLSCFAEITGAWTTQDEQVLAVLEPLHVYAPGFLQTRLKWRAKEPLTLLELRCHRLEQPLVIPTRPDYFGCFSWVELLPEDSRGSCWQATAALDDGEFAGKQHVLRERLQKLQVQQLKLQ